MKKVFLMLALAALVFASCGNKEEEPIDLSKQVIGKWMLSKMDGAIVPTNSKIVFTFESDSMGYVSASRVDYTESQTKWANHAPTEIIIEDMKISMFGNINKTTAFMAEITVTSFAENEMQANLKYTVYHNGTPLYETSGTTTWARVAKEYSADILGTWEGHVTNSEGSEFDDGELHRWQYMDDDTYVYYHLGADSSWTPQSSELSEYFVDGVLLCTRWKNTGEGEVENREWWEIASIENGVMNWTALRMREDGSTFTATFSMTRVQ